MSSELNVNEVVEKLKKIMEGQDVLKVGRYEIERYYGRWGKDNFVVKNLQTGFSIYVESKDGEYWLGILDKENWTILWGYEEHNLVKIIEHVVREVICK